MHIDKKNDNNKEIKSIENELPNFSSIGSNKNPLEKIKEIRNNAANYTPSVQYLKNFK